MFRTWLMLESGFKKWSNYFVQFSFRSLLNVRKTRFVADTYQYFYLLCTTRCQFSKSILLFLFLQHWKDVSGLAKDFINRLLVLDPSERMTASQALKHAWLTTSAASSSNKNLHRTISKNLLERQSTRNSVKSAKSTKSTKSNKSNRSARSLRSEHRRVMPEEIDELHKDPEVQAELSSLGGGS